MLVNPDNTPSPFELVQISGIIAGFTVIGTVVKPSKDLAEMGTLSALATMLLVIAGLFFPVVRVWPKTDLLGWILTVSAGLALSIGAALFGLSLAFLVRTLQQLPSNEDLDSQQPTPVGDVPD